jgi:lipoprotein-anchoring transpeptidase ErfK/SrfK
VAPRPAADLAERPGRLGVGGRRWPRRRIRADRGRPVRAKVDTGRPSGPYGSYILGLSGFSEAIHPSDWPGLPRLAIHGTDDQTDAGQAISSGCIRVPNALLRQLRDVPMGTPVVIRR